MTAGPPDNSPPEPLIPPVPPMTCGAATGEKTAEPNDGWLTRERALAGVLIAVSVIVFYLCYRLALPFLPALAWALALAVIAYPTHARIRCYVKNANLAAGLAVASVVVLVVVPILFVTAHLVREAGSAARVVQEQIRTQEWRERLEKSPRLRPVLDWFDSQFSSSKPAEAEGLARQAAEQGDLPTPETATPETAAPETGAADNGTSSAVADETPSEGAVAIDPRLVAPEANETSVPWARGLEMLGQGVGVAVAGAVWLGMQILITVLCLFFFLRDRHHALEVVRSLMPLSRPESEEVFQRVDDTIHATIFGAVVVAAVQGAMGGLMFWWLGLPSPLVWGAVMGLLAVVPVLGTFVIWAPTAAYLALQGDIGRAAILTAWGMLAIGLIDNFLNPFLVGKRLRFHTLLVFFAILGGLAQFGASGIILGPVLLAIADALLHIWKRRTAYGGTIEDGVQCGA